MAPRFTAHCALGMDYVGIDFRVDLACSSCKDITCIPYSRLLTLVAAGTAVRCTTCGRSTLHDWRSVSKAQQLIGEYFAERARTGRRVAQSY